MRPYLTEAENALMAELIYKRFGYDAVTATAAWNRLLRDDAVGYNTTKADFLALVGQAPKMNLSR